MLQNKLLKIVHVRKVHEDWIKNELKQKAILEMNKEEKRNRTEQWRR